LQEIQVAVAGGTLTLTQFPVLTAIRVGARVVKIAGPVVAGLGKGLDLDDLVNGKIGAALAGGEIDLNKSIPGALNAIAEHLDPEAFARLCGDLLGGGFWVGPGIGGVQEKIETGEPNALDRIFGGDLPGLFAALKGALQVNNFFGLSAIGKLRGAPKAPATNPSPAG
jgi:hypothetical protein